MRANLRQPIRPRRANLSRFGLHRSTRWKRARHAHVSENAFDPIAARPYRDLVSGRDDRRSSGLRAPIELKVEYKRLNSFFADYTKNISRGGTFIRTDRPLDIGTDFVFKLGIPTLGEPLVLQGKVQWIITPEQATPEQEAGMGIGFVFATEAERQRVEGAVERLMIDNLGPVLYGKLMGSRDR
jgi:type IV pilus assembly protein PilZ